MTVDKKQMKHWPLFIKAAALSMLGQPALTKRPSGDGCHDPWAGPIVCTEVQVMAVEGVADVQDQVDRMLDGLSDDALRVVARAALDRLPEAPEMRVAPKSSPAIPDPPRWLNGAGVKLWDQLASVLWETGRLTKLDVPALALMCHSWGHCVQAARDRDPLTFSEVLEDFVMLADRFEMVPAARL